MNALLIYNDQLFPNSIKNQFEEDNIGIAVNYKVLKSDLIEPNFNIDKHISNFLMEDEIELKKYDVIFLPYSLSTSNYSEYIGLRMAYHIRLTDEFVNLQTPIVFYGEEEPWELCKVILNGQILFTQNISTTKKISVESFRKQLKYILKEFNQEKDDKEFLKGFVKRITILPPSSYNSHHSVNNESALLKWSEEIGCDKDIPEVKDNLQTGLYFKYLKALSKIKKTVDENLEDEDIEDEGDDADSLSKESKILLIDDEAEKGWAKFYEAFFKGSSNRFEYLKTDFKNSSNREAIIGVAMNRIKEAFVGELPDVVLLDLRLHDDDFDENIKPRKFTGFQILQEIKKINKGIQVIITSASNKIWNYEALMNGEFKADGYILKNGEEDVEKTINNMTLIINNSIKKSKPLKIFFEKMSQIQKYSSRHEEVFSRNVSANLEISFELFEKSFEKAKFKNYSFLQCYLILEEFIKQHSIFEEDSDVIVKANSDEICVAKKINKKIISAIKLTQNGKYEISTQKSNKRIDVNYIVSSLLIFRYGNPNSSVKNWTTVNRTRNTKAGHYDKTKPDSIINFSEICMLMEFLLYILNDDNINDANFKKGLAKRTYEDSLEDLKNSPHFKKDRN